VQPVARLQQRLFITQLQPEFVIIFLFQILENRPGVVAESGAILEYLEQKYDHEFRLKLSDEESLLQSRLFIEPGLLHPFAKRRANRAQQPGHRRFPHLSEDQVR
jgi:glutathione S-transferase